MIDQFFQKIEVFFNLKGFAEAFARGGLEEERKERANFKKE